MADARCIGSRRLGAAEIATAFVGNVLSRAVAADVDLYPEEVQVVRASFGAP